MHDAWVRISNEMQISIPELKKKKEALMATFRQHLKKKKASISSGCSEEDVYKPIWVFYDIMETFLEDVYECSSKKNTLGIFKLPKFDVQSSDDFLSLLITNDVDEVFVEQSFPYLMVNMTEPLYAEDICKSENGCNLSPNWERFVGLSVRDVAITYGQHYGMPVASRWMQNAWRIFRGTLHAESEALGLISTLNAMPAASEAIGASTSSINSAVFELAPLAVHTASTTGGIVVQSAQRGTAVIQGMRAWHSARNLVHLTTPVEILSGGTLGATVSMKSINGLKAATAATRSVWIARIGAWLSKFRARRDVNSQQLPRCESLFTDAPCVLPKREKRSLRIPEKVTVTTPKPNNIQSKTTTLTTRKDHAETKQHAK